MAIGLTVAAVFMLVNAGSGEAAMRFDLNERGVISGDVERTPPAHVVQLAPEYGGQWVLLEDIDGDGQVEIISAQNHNADDVHYTSTAVAQKLDGTVLWRWGDPSVGRKHWAHDVALQVHDWNRDRRKEVILLTEGRLVELDAETGEEARSFAIPAEATDCLVFCDLRGSGWPADVLVKNRYEQIWAYDDGGNLLWTVEKPGGQLTAHQPVPIDLDGDGRDEIMAGYALLNPDGTIRWTYASKAVDQGAGHLDCARVLKAGASPEETRITLTCCGAENLTVIDGAGKVVWEEPGAHFESIDIGSVTRAAPGPQIVADIDHQPWGESPLMVFDADGKAIGRITTDYSRHHALVDWNGDGLQEIVMAHVGAIYSGAGERVAVLDAPQPREHDAERSVLVGDFTGDGREDVALVTPDAVRIYRNPAQAEGNALLGTGLNFSLY